MSAEPESWAPEVQTAGSGGAWTGNSLRFADKQDAHEWVQGLMMRWTAVCNVRVVPSGDTVNYDRGKRGELRRIG